MESLQHSVETGIGHVGADRSSDAPCFQLYIRFRLTIIYLLFKKRKSLFLQKESVCYHLHPLELNSIARWKSEGIWKESIQRHSPRERATRAEHRGIQDNSLKKCHACLLFELIHDQMHHVKQRVIVESWIMLWLSHPHRYLELISLNRNTASFPYSTTDHL